MLDWRRNYLPREEVVDILDMRPIHIIYRLIEAYVGPRRFHLTLVEDLQLMGFQSFFVELNFDHDLFFVVDVGCCCINWLVLKELSVRVFGNVVVNNHVLETVRKVTCKQPYSASSSGLGL